MRSRIRQKYLADFVGIRIQENCGATLSVFVSGVLLLNRILQGFHWETRAGCQNSGRLKNRIERRLSLDRLQIRVRRRDCRQRHIPQ